MAIYANAGDGNEEITQLHAPGISADALNLDILTDAIQDGRQRLQQIVQSHVNQPSTRK
jgi:hypothetical protein